jgi:glycosyltransferase involved in cell wall biosynthesis
VSDRGARLRVALDLAHLRLGSAGTARHARGLLDALSARTDVDAIAMGAGPLLPHGTVARRAAAARDDLLWYPWLARARARSLGAGVYHSPVPRGPLWPGRPPTVVTVHDLAVLLYPETLSPWNRRYTRATLRRIVGAADRVVVPSADTAADATRLLGLSPDRVRVVPNGVDARFFGAPRSAAPIGGSYVLFVGTPEPRKNLDGLGRAMELLWTGGRRERLVLVGADGWGAPAALAGPVTSVGRVSDDALHALYACAACLVLPSLHEGFGLPAIEAMAAGCPVVASRAGALPEVCGDAACLVDPADPRSIAAGIADAIDGADALRVRGRARAAHFTWTAAADRLVAVYRELA